MPYQVTCHLRSGEIIYNDEYHYKSFVSQFLNDIFTKNGDFMCQIVTPQNTNILFYLYKVIYTETNLVISLDGVFGYGIMFNCNIFVVSPIKEEETSTYMELFSEYDGDKNKLINLIDKLHNRCEQIYNIVHSAGSNTSPISSIKRSPKN